MKNVRIPMVFALAFTAATGCEALGGATRAQQAYTLSSEPQVVVGGHDERRAYQFQYPVGAFRLSDGRIVIADAGPRELRYFDRTGQHLRTVGRTGAGPGEFNNLRSISRIRGDTIVAWDGVMRRASLFTGDGQFVQVVSLEDGWSQVVAAFGREGRLDSWSVALAGLKALGTGELVAESFFERPPSAMEGERVAQDTLPVVVFHRNGNPVRTLGPFPGDEVFLRNRTGSLRTFGERLVVAAGTDLIYVGSTRSRVIRGFSPATGQVVRSMSLPIEPRRFSSQDVPPPGSGPIAEHRRAMPLPQMTPVFQDIRYGSDGRLWVQRYRLASDAYQEWLGFAETGAHVASLMMDPSVGLLDIGSDYAIVHATDDLDVSFIRLHRLIPR